MVFRLFLRFFVTIFAISLTSVQSDIDIRCLRGSYANLKEPQFSILHGAAAKKKLTNLFLFNSNQTEIEKLVKQLFHQINNRLVPPAAVSRPTSYLSFHELGLLVAAMHQKFPQLLVEDLKKTITELYDAKAAAQFTPEKLLDEVTQARLKKDKTRFTQELELFFKTLATATANPNYNYDAYAAVLGLLYVKAGSLNDLNSYYEGLAKGLGIKLEELFIVNKIDTNSYSHDVVVEHFKNLQSSVINSDFVANLAQNHIAQEQAICSMLLINKGGNNLPQEIRYSAAMFENNSYPDCFETSLLNVLQVLTFDSDSGLCSLENLKNYGINPETIDEGLRRFYTDPIITPKYTVSACNPTQAGDSACHNAFSAIVSNRPWVTYGRCTNGDNSKSIYLKLASHNDYQPFIAASQESNIQPDSNGCYNVKNISLLPAYEHNENKTYEVKSTLKNFIIVLDQLLQLGLFTGADNSLEKIYWDNDFEKKQFECIAKKFNWEYEIIFDLRGDTTVKIDKIGYYSFSLRFNHNLHTEYKVITDNAQERLTHLSVFEAAHINKLFDYAACAHIISDEDKIKLFNQNRKHSFSTNLLYFCDMENLTTRYQIFKTITAQEPITPAQLSFAKSILLSPAPINDAFHRGMVIPIFAASIEVCKKLAHQKDGGAVKVLLLTIGMLQNDEKFVGTLLGMSTIDTNINWEFLCDHIVKHNKQNFVFTLIESLAKYNNTNVIGTLLSKFLEAYPNKQEKEKIFKKIDLLLKGERLQLQQSTKTALNIAIDRERLLSCQDDQSRDEITLKILQYYRNDIRTIHTKQLLNIFDLMLSKQYPVDNIIKHALPDKMSCWRADDQEVKLFEWLAQKGLKLSEAFDVAIATIKDSTSRDKSKALSILSLLIKQESHIDEIIEAAQIAFDSCISEDHFLSLKLFKVLIEKGFTLSQIAQKITKNFAESKSYSASAWRNSYFSEKIDLLLLLLSKDIEIDLICKAAATLFVNNKIKESMKIFNKLLKKGYGQKELLYAIFQKPNERYCFSTKNPLDKLLNEDKDLGFIKSEALVAMDSDNCILVQGALSVFGKLIEKNKGYEEALQCVEKTIGSSDPKTKNIALDLLIKIYYKQTGPRHYTVDNVLLERIAGALQQGISLSGNINYSTQQLLQDIMEKGFALGTGLTIAQAYLKEDDPSKMKFSLKLFRILAEKELNLEESLSAVQKVMSCKETRFDTILLLQELIEKGVGLKPGKDLDLIADFMNKITSDEDLYLQKNINTMVHFAALLVERGYCHESAARIIIYSLNSRSQIIGFAEVNLLEKLFGNDYTTPELIDAIASRLLKSNDAMSNEKVISLFKKLLPSDDNFESIHTVANRLLNEGLSRHKQLGFKLLINLAEQHYKPAYEFPLTTIKELISDYLLQTEVLSYIEILINQEHKLDELHQILAEYYNKNQTSFFDYKIKKLMESIDTQRSSKKRSPISGLDQQGDKKRSKYN